MTEDLRFLFDDIVALEEVKGWLLKPIGCLFPKRAKLQDVLFITKQVVQAKHDFWFAVRQKYPEAIGTHLSANSEQITMSED